MARYSVVIYSPGDPTFLIEDFATTLAESFPVGQIEIVMFDSDHRPAYEFTRQQ